MIRIGIVGCGRILAAHLQGYRILREAGFDDFRITALCARRESDARMYLRRDPEYPQRPPCSNIEGDPLAVRPEYLEDFQETGDVEVYTDYREMLSRAPIDAVNDLTSHGMHHLIADEAFRRGLHLLSQKPLAATVRAARRMCDQADAAKCVLATFECFRFAPVSRALEWLFRSGRGGTFQMALLGYFGAWWAPDRIVADTPWRHSKSEAGGITLDLGVHFFDQLRMVAGQPTSILGTTDVLEPVRYRRDEHGTVWDSIDCDADDTTWAHIAFESGARCDLMASWGGHVAPTLLGSGSVYYGSAVRVDGSSAQFEDGTTCDIVDLFTREADPEETERAFPKEMRDWFALGQHDWLEAIRHGRQPETSGYEGLVDLAASYAILESAEAGRRVTLDEVLSGKLRDYQRPIDRAIGLDD